MLSILAASKISSVDVWFFTIILVIIAVCVAIYFLAPLINQKKYRQQREALKKREEIFLANQEAKKNESNEQN